jgi:outer membrane protein assembly factor BamB
MSTSGPGAVRRRGSGRDVVRQPIALAAAALLAAACDRTVETLYVRQLESPSFSSPLVTRDLVIFGSDEGGVYGYTKDGNRKWQFNPNLRQVFSAPDWDRHTLVFFGATNQNVYAITADKGEQVWVVRTQDRIKGDPTYWNGVVYIGSYDKHLYALDAKTGRTRWVFPATTPPKPPKGRGAAARPPLVDEEHAVSAAEFSYSKPLVVNGVLYVGNLDGHLYAIDALTGELRWRFRTGRGSETGGVGVTSSPAWANGVLYFGSSDHHVYALSDDGTQVRWDFQTGDAVLASPLVDDGAVYVGSEDRNLYAIDAASGRLRWKLAGQGPFVSSPALHGRHLVQCGGAGDGTIRLVEKETGKVVWSRRTDRKIESDPTVVGDAVFITGGDARLYALQIDVR